MARKFRDLTGETFEEWTVLHYVGIKYSSSGKTKEHFWKCECSCGQIREIPTGTLRFKRSRSCGCKAAELAIATGNIRTHNMTDTSTYSSWQCMKRRCSSDKDPNYHSYGGRGITVCERWENSFENFLEDMGEKPDGYSLERIDVNKGYYKENCCWIPKRRQARNLRKTIWIELDGETKCLADWCDEYEIDRKLVLGRYYMGWDIKKALTTPKLFNRSPNKERSKPASVQAS